MSDSNWKLCARLVTPGTIFEYYLVSYTDKPPGYVEIWEYRPGFPDPGPFSYLGPFYYPGQRFPVGYEVYPD